MLDSKSFLATLNFCAIKQLEITRQIYLICGYRDATSIPVCLETKQQKRNKDLYTTYDGAKNLVDIKCIFTFTISFKLQFKFYKALLTLCTALNLFGSY